MNNAFMCPQCGVELSETAVECHHCDWKKQAQSHVRHPFIVRWAFLVPLAIILYFWGPWK